MFTRRQLLGAGAAAFLPTGGSLAASAAPHLVVVFLRGGWDVTHGVDPKLGEPGFDGPDLDEDPSDPDDREAVQTFGDSAIAVNPVKRPSVGRFFERWGPRCTVVNGVWVGSVAHETCTVRMLTGSRDRSAPDVATIVGFERGASAPIPTLDLGGASLPGPLASSTGRAGTHQQLLDLLAPEGASTQAERDLVEAHLHRRITAQQATRGRRGRGAERLAGARASLIRSRDLLAVGPSLADALRVPGRSTLTARADAAVNALQAGVCHVAVLDSGAAWDTHTDNTLQHANHKDLFAGLDHLMARLHAEQMLDRTLVWVVSEMARAPRRNRTGGKDHGVVTSSLLLGAGVRGGVTVGRTDGTGTAQPVALTTGEVSPHGTVLRYDHLAAGVLTASGVDPAAWLPGVPAFEGAFA